MTGNPCGHTPLGKAVIVKQYEVKERFAGSSLYIPEQVRRENAVVEQRAVVVAFGEDAKTTGIGSQLHPGDHVVIGKYNGYIFMGTDGELYRAITVTDIFLKIENPEAFNGE